MRERAAELGGTVRCRPTDRAARGCTSGSRRCCRDRRRRCGSRSSTTTRCSGWGWPRRSATWTASSSSARPSGSTRSPTWSTTTAPDVRAARRPPRRRLRAGGQPLARRAPSRRAGRDADDVGGRDTALTALRDGACGYLVKGVGPERVEHALRAVAAGDVVLDQTLVAAMTELAAPVGRRRPPVPGADQPRVRHPVADRRRSRQRGDRPPLDLARRPCATTCPTCSPRSTPTIDRTPSSWRAAWASAPDPQARRRGQNAGIRRRRRRGTWPRWPASRPACARRHDASGPVRPRRQVGSEASRRIASVAGQPAGILSTMAASSTRVRRAGGAPRHRPSCRPP